MTEKKNGNPADKAPASSLAAGSPGGDYQHYLVLATPREAQKLLTELGDGAVLIKVMAPRRKGGEQ